MSLNNVSGNSAPTQVTTFTGVDIISDAKMKTMSPEDILNYVRSALGNIDGQMNDYKDKVAAQQQKAADLREAQNLMSEMKNGEGWLKDFDQEKYNRLMTILGKHSGDQQVEDLYNSLLESVGPFNASEDFTGPDGTLVKAGEQQNSEKAYYKASQYFLDESGNPVVDPATNLPITNPDWDPVFQDRVLDNTEVQTFLDNTKRVLEDLNSGNEMVMMDLQKLMQQRNQITQFASNFLNVDHETKKSILGNIR